MCEQAFGLKARCTVEPGLYWHFNYHLRTTCGPFLWSQLILVDGVAYKPGPCNEAIEIPLIPKTLCKSSDVCVEKTLARLHQEAFWVNMAYDVDE